ncbi:MAG TPA: M23 family metallopeptidase [Rubricoccaceae bacterium]|nr:M23 family metallopeptidase [Rubricoccaceae bacterium]
MLNRFAPPGLRRLAVPMAAVPLVAAALAMTPPGPAPSKTSGRLVAVGDTVRPAAPGAAGISAAAMEAAGLPLRPAALSFAPDRLLVPVAGLGPEDLVDTFAHRRSGGRVHEAIDIMAPRGTPVVAVADGRIASVRSNRLGGKVLYLVSPDGRYRFYYAHLDGYARGIASGVTVYQGDTLGYVGNTGNARATAPHLHFQVMEGGGRAVHSGRKVNPYALLRRSRLYADGRTRG